MSVLTAIVGLNNYCKSQAGPLKEVPRQYDETIARLTQESDKSLADLAKFIKSKVLPTDADSQRSNSEGESEEILPLSVIETAIERVAERTNYGLGASDVASSSHKTATAEDIPAPLQLWRWEVRDTSLLQPERVAEMLKRREERKAARQKALELFNALAPAQQQELLSSKKKSKPTKAQKTQSVAASNSTTAIRESTPDKQQPTHVVARTKSTSTSPTKPASEADSKADSGVIIVDDDDDDEADDEAAGGSNGTSPSASRRRKSADSIASPSQANQVKPKKRAKLETLTPQQIAERERREQEKEEKRKAKEAKDVKKQKELEAKKKSASLFTGFFNKKPATTAAPASPTKQGIAAASGPSPTAAQTSVFERTFIQTAYKDLAPLNRFNRDADLGLLDQVLSSSEAADSPSHLLSKITKASGRQRRSRPQRKRGIHPPVNVRETMRLVAESDLMVGDNADEQVRKALQNLKDRRKVPLKLLQFATDLRPGWFGTWTRPSNLISGRKPLRQDPVALDYNYDSEAEWVDGDGEDRGEEVGDDNDDADDAGSADGDDSEMDDWLVDDLEEVEGDGPADDGDAMSDIIEVDSAGRPMSPSHDRSNSRGGSPTRSPANPPKRRRMLLPGLANKKKAMAKQKRVKNSRRFTQKLVPVTIGPHWQEEIGQAAHPTFAGYEIEFLNGAYPGLDPFTFVDEETGPIAAGHDVDSAAKTTTSSKPTHSGALATAEAAAPAQTALGTASSETAKSKPPLVPEEHLPNLLQAVEGSTDTKLMLQEKLALQFKGIKAVTKVAVAATLTQACEREGKKSDSPWRVKAEWRAQAGLS